MAIPPKQVPVPEGALPHLEAPGSSLGCCLSLRQHQQEPVKDAEASLKLAFIGATAYKSRPGSVCQSWLEYHLRTIQIESTSPKMVAKMSRTQSQVTSHLKNQKNSQLE
jgi:hypothetical protein